MAMAAWFRSALDLVLGEDSSEPPAPPFDLPADAAAIVREGVQHLIAYQNAEYAEHYLSRLQRFVHRPGVGPDLLIEIARQLPLRMSYGDPVYLAQLKLQRIGHGEPPSEELEAVRFPLSDIVSLLPEGAAKSAVVALSVLGWSNLRTPLRLTARTAAGLRKLKAIVLLRRFRPMSLRYLKERALVERWLHMIDRSLTLRPEIALEVVRTASIIQGCGFSYHSRVARWNIVIDHLVKPALEDKIMVPDLRAAVARLREAAEQGVDGARLRQFIEEIKSSPPPSAAA